MVDNAVKAAGTRTLPGLSTGHAAWSSLLQSREADRLILAPPALLAGDATLGRTGRARPTRPLAPGSAGLPLEISRAGSGPSLSALGSRPHHPVPRRALSPRRECRKARFGRPRSTLGSFDSFQPPPVRLFLESSIGADKKKARRRNAPAGPSGNCWRLQVG